MLPVLATTTLGRPLQWLVENEYHLPFTSDVLYPFSTVDVTEVIGNNYAGGCACGGCRNREVGSLASQTRRWGASSKVTVLFEPQ